MRVVKQNPWKYHHKDEHMKNIMTTTLAILVFAAGLQMTANADDPINPVQGAVCNMYWMGVQDLDDEAADDAKTFTKWTASLPKRPAVATFVDDSMDFACPEKAMDVESDVGVWTGWLRAEQGGTYTFLCDRYCNSGWEGCGWYRYSVWINGQKGLECKYGQRAFNAQLNAGFNAVKIIVWGLLHDEDDERPLSITYKKAGSLKEPMTFGPMDMFHDDEE
jgi:hypothetical protein